MNIFSKLKQKIIGNMSPDSIKKMKRLWVEYVLPQWKLLALSMIFMCIYSILNAWSVSLLKPVFDKVFIEQNRDVLFTIAVEVIIAFGAKGVAQYFQSVTMTILGANFTKRLQGDLYDRVIAQDLEFFHKNN